MEMQNKNIKVCFFCMVAALASACAGAVVMSSNNTCGSTKFTHATHNVSKYIPPDIAALPERSIIKQKYDKMFRIIPDPIRNWADKKYEDRRRFLEGPFWEKARASLVDKLSRMQGKLKKQPAVTEEEILKLAEETVRYGRGLVSGSFQEMPTFEEIAMVYKFNNVAKFLKKALDFDRYRSRGMEEVYPDDPEFNDFETLAKALNENEWTEVRRRWEELNKKFEENVKIGKAIRKRQPDKKPGKKN